ncbi:EcsC family protein [Pontibacter flavimaris]|uniref:ABC transporter-associated protein EcsC n=1 Tax=Pontibacter flavimaris TaxID=1797110 RepID=A0A1Q5P8V7_9BACT|nr:EcsC family protein [Pontibacter flavimaris]OKL38572.1 ABC transporter-associated protein EcsC [Pontibacter flavimaris]
MSPYEAQALYELRRWQHEMLRDPGMFNALARRAQVKLNSFIPEKVHKAITSAMKQMIQGVLFGAGYISQKPLEQVPLEVREGQVRGQIKYYQQAAAAEGGVTGAGGILLGLVDFPLLLGLKLKLLYDIAALYGYDIKDYRERVYLLHIFELAFSSQEHRRNVYLHLADWESQKLLLPEDINAFDWRSLQQEYRDYIDLAKMAQLIPIIGAPIGAVVNYRLITKLGETAINAYRLRLKEQGLLQA